MGIESREEDAIFLTFIPTGRGLDGLVNVWETGKVREEEKGKGIWREKEGKGKGAGIYLEGGAGGREGWESDPTTVVKRV